MAGQPNSVAMGLYLCDAEVSQPVYTPLSPLKLSEKGNECEFSDLNVVFEALEVKHGNI